MSSIKLKLEFIPAGADSMTVPNVVMNSLVSATKVITNDIIPNPITATLNPIALPTISLPVPSIGIPVMNVKIGNVDDKLGNESTSLEVEVEPIETEDEKLSDTKKSDELMPVEDDTIIELAHKIEENIAETDVEVGDATDPIGTDSEIEKAEDSLNALNKCDVDLHVVNDHLNVSEPMECASVNSMASPKHTMTNDVIMAESISVSWKIPSIL